MKRSHIAILTVLLVLIFDQILKIWVKTSLYLGESAADFGIFEIYFIENNGMAFGTELGGTTGKLLLSLFRVVAIGGIGYYLYTLIKKQHRPGLIVAISLILAGAFGNLIDSLFYGLMFGDSPEVFFRDVIPPAEMFPSGGGYAPFLQGKVVDMIHFTVNWPSGMPWVGGDPVFPPVFNIADAAISVGVCMIIIWQKRYFPKKGATETENIPSDASDVFNEIDPVDEISTEDQSIAVTINPESVFSTFANP